MIDCSEQTISNIETGRYLSTDKAVKIARVFNVPPDYVLGKIEDPSEYKKRIVNDISLMSQAIAGVESFITYLIASEGKRKFKLSESEKQSLMSEIIWYGRMRIEKIIKERGELHNAEEGPDKRG